MREQSALVAASARKVMQVRIASSDFFLQHITRDWRSGAGDGAKLRQYKLGRNIHWQAGPEHGWDKLFFLQ